MLVDICIISDVIIAISVIDLGMVGVATGEAHTVGFFEVTAAIFVTILLMLLLMLVWLLNNTVPMSRLVCPLGS